MRWSSQRSTPWLVAERPAGDQVVAGVTFGFGLLHQPTPHLGVAGLFAAWLTASLNRPIEGAEQESRRIMLHLGQTESSLIVGGAEETVRAALGRMDRLIADPSSAELDESMVDRSRAYGNPLSVWRSHLAARWPGHRPHLSALGPLALSTLDADALHTFVAGCVAPADRVYWTNEPGLADSVDGPAAARVDGPPAARVDGPPAARADGPAAARAESLAAPAGWRAEPGCLVESAAGEMFSIAVRRSAAADVALTLLLGALHRRMVEFEPLATDVTIAAHQAGGGIVLACCDAGILPGKDADARAAIAQTIEDIASGSVADEQIARVRQAMVDGGWEAGADLVGTMSALARRHLAQGGFPTPESVAREFERVADGAVSEELARFLPQLLLAVPMQQALSDPPFPMAERVLVEGASGRGFPDRTARHRMVRCSAERVGIVETAATGRFWRTRRPVTRASVKFDEVVLRLDVGDYATTLLDTQLHVVELVWDGYRRADRLRELVDSGVGAVPVIQQRPDPEASQRVRALVKRHLRRTALAGAGAAAAVAAVAAIIAYGVTHDSPDPIARTVDQGATVRLGNGTTLSIVDGPELIEHYNRSITNVYGVQMRLCAGKVYPDRLSLGEARNYFGAEKFRLQVGEGSLQPDSGLQDRPAPPGDYVESGNCATGWLLFRLPTAGLPQAPSLRYSNIDDDRITWRLPATAARSELSQPCPSPTPDIFGKPVDSGWVGCPTPPAR